jgi:hypothetical protein
LQCFFEAMRPSHEEMVEFLRALHGRPGGTGAILNLVWASKLRGSIHVAALTDLVLDQGRKMELARHGADEARHVYLVLRRMDELGFRAFRLPGMIDRIEGLLSRTRARDMAQLYAERAVVNDAELLEVVLACFIAEQDAVRRMRANFEALRDDPLTGTLIGAIHRDDERHVAYLSRWLETFEARFSRRAVAAARQRLEALFDELTATYYAGLGEYLERAVA